MFALEWVLGLAMAQGQAELVEGRPAFQDCLENPSCAERFYRFLSGSMVEQGFTFAQDAGPTGALQARQEGWHLGGSLTTFPFSPPRENLSGKAEETDYSPVLPRLRVGLVDHGAQRRSLALTFLPPVPVGGASALVLGLEGALAWEVGPLRWGVEADAGFTRARAPIVATEEQLENREDFDNPNNLDPEQYAEVCEPVGGCVDTFLATQLHTRALVGVPLGEAWVPSLGLGLGLVHQSLAVAYDETRWALFGLQPSATLGVAWLPRGRLGLGVNAAIAPRAAQLDPVDPPDAGLLFRMAGGLSVRLGQAPPDPAR